MRLPALRWLVLLFTCAWFGVLVPIHQRGAIQLGGGSSRACCPAPAQAVAATEDTDEAVPACHRVPAKAKPEKSHCPPADSSSSSGGACAVCFFVAGLDMPVPVMLDVPPLGFAEALALFDLPAPAELEHVRTRFERGPPAA